jgi:hypothetical protein
LLLRRAQGLNDLAKLEAIVENFTFGSSFTNFLLHLEGEVFGFAKWPIDFPSNADKDFHCHDSVNFTYPHISVPAFEPNFVEDVHTQQPPSGSNDSLPLLSRGGLQLKENICVDG